MLTRKTYTDINLGMETEDVMKMLRDKQGDMSLREFADVVGCSAAYLSDLYRGNREPGNKIMRFLGLRKRRIVESTYAKAK